MHLAKVLGAIGRVCVTAGVLTLLFVAYQLWGTGIREAQAQDRLEDEFEQVVGDAPAPPTADPAAMAQIRIPKIGVEKIVVSGVSLEDLKRGPGHYPDTPMPGQPGNSAIAGHRTTYGAPFYRLGELPPGGLIVFTPPQGR